jgi:PAS domain S-box-containing protein
VAREARVDGRIKVVGRPLAEIKRGMAVRKGNKELLARLDQAVRAFVASPDYREVYAKWYGRPAPLWTVVRVTWAMAALLVLSLGVMAVWRHLSILKLNRNLKDREARLANAQRIAHLGSYEWHIAQDQLVWTDETYRIFGLTKDSFQPTVEGFVSHIHPDDRAAVKTAIDTALANAGPYDVSFRIARADGDERVLHDQGELDFDASGKPWCMRGVVHDVTEQTRADEEIHKLNEELEQRVEARTVALHAAQEELVRKERLATLGQLTAMVSHELRNPLGAMRSSVDAIKKLASTDNHLLKRSVELADRSVIRCDNIIGDLLDYSRVPRLQPEPTAVDDWLASLLDEYELPPGITLRRELACQAELAFDRDRMRRALLNLLDNACQAMAACEGEPVLTVASRLEGDRVEVSIDDTGPGIASESLERIFEPLYSTKSFGVGLGLSIVKRIAGQHGGGIEVGADTKPNGGARMVLWLPLQEPARKAAS